MFVGETNCGARFSDCRAYRYTLWRRWVDGCPLSRMVAFIGLNPSTADETINDPTVTRCIGFAKSWKYDGMVMLNLFAFRATDPKVMKSHPEPIGSSNDDAIRDVTREVAEVVLAWGNHGRHLRRGDSVVNMLSHIDTLKACHLGLTNAPEPKHPLYLSAKTARVPFATYF